MITSYKIFEGVKNLDISLEITRYDSKDFYSMTYSVFNDFVQNFVAKYLQLYNSYNRDNSRSFRTWLYKLESLYFQAYIINFDKRYLELFKERNTVKINTEDIQK